MDQAPGDVRKAAVTHLDALYTFALSLTRNPPDAEDLVQETYLRAFRFAHRFQPGTHLRAWLFQILRNTFFTFYSRSARELLILDKEASEGGEEDWDVEALRNPVGTVVDLERALAELSEDFRSVVLLADLQGFPLAQVGNIMDIPVGTVKSRLHRARRMLRRRLTDYRAR